jgi:thymidylate kinase
MGIMSTRRRGFTVALIGPDGAGKTSVARGLAPALGRPVSYLYMGVSADSSTSLLPTTRLAHTLKRRRGAAPDIRGPRDHREVAGERRRGRRRAAAALRASLRLANRLAEEWSRQARAWALVRRGSIVVFDRHFFADYYAYDIAGNGTRPLSRRLHGLVLARVYPRPDLTIYLDAPADVLLARKGEGTAELLERRRVDYLQLADVLERFVVVDATKPLEEVTRDVAAVVGRFAEGSAPAALR